MGRRAAKNAVRKGKADALKAKLNGRYGKLVLQAAKAGGPNPETNKTLHTIMDQARKAGVPRDIIDRNVKRSADKATAELAEHLIEVYGPGGSGFVMDCLTDSKARAVSEIWTIVKKLNGKMGDNGSVLFNFERRGEVALAGISEDAAFDAAVAAAADDVEPLVDDDGGVAGYTVVSSVDAFGPVRDALYAMDDVSVNEERTGLAFKPRALVEVADDVQFQANVDIFERCLELEDVDAIYTTCADVGLNK